MAIPFFKEMRIGGYLLKQKLLGRKRYPLVLMLEPLFRCNLACPGCGKPELFLDAGHMFTETPASAMTDLLDQPLSTVGAADAGSVTIRAAGRPTLVTAAAGEGKTR